MAATVPIPIPACSPVLRVFEVDGLLLFGTIVGWFVDDAEADADADAEGDADEEGVVEVEGEIVGVKVGTLIGLGE